jgi:outer membrane protein OmpU
MKKVLFATTALVATAGVASADIALSGFAEMGFYDTNVSNTRARFFTDIDVTFTMSGETDHGLTFGASVDLDEALNQNAANAAWARNGAMGNNDDDGGATMFVSGAFGTLTMGDTDGAFDWAMQEVGMVGSINDDETGHGGYNAHTGFDGANDGQIARYDYTFGDISVALSAEVDDTINNLTGVQSLIWGAGAKYTYAFSGGTATFGAAYQGYRNASVFGGTVGVAMDNGISAVGSVESRSGAAVTNWMHYNLGVGYAWDAFAFHANAGLISSTAITDRFGVGVAASYDLGGGMKLHAGYGAGHNGVVPAYSWSFGAKMTF